MDEGETDIPAWSMNNSMYMDEDQDTSATPNFDRTSAVPYPNSEWKYQDRKFRPTQTRPMSAQGLHRNTRWSGLDSFEDSSVRVPPSEPKQLFPAETESAMIPFDKTSECQNQEMKVEEEYLRKLDIVWKRGIDDESKLTTIHRKLTTKLLEERKRTPGWWGNTTMNTNNTSLRHECETWMLLEEMFSCEKGEKMWFHFFIEYFRRVRINDSSQDYQKLMNNLLLREIVLRWLQRVAASRSDESDTRGNIINLFTKKTLDDMEKSGESLGMPISLDPDAPQRENFNVDNEKYRESKNEDAREKAALMRKVWRRLQMGKIEQAQDLCRESCWSHMAAMLEKMKIWPEGLSTQEICERILEEFDRTICCAELLDQFKRLDRNELYREHLYEEYLVFSILAGEVIPDPNAYEGWLEACWSNFSKAIKDTRNEIFKFILRENIERTKRKEKTSIVLHVDAEQDFNQKNPAEINRILNSIPDSAKIDIRNPYHELQKLIICWKGRSNNLSNRQSGLGKEIEKMLTEYVSSIVRSPHFGLERSILEEMQISTELYGTPSLYQDFSRRRLDPATFLRFSVHLYLSYRPELTHQDPRDQECLSEHGEIIIKAYIAYLIQNEQYTLVPGYLRYLSDNDQKSLYVFYLNRLSREEARKQIEELQQSGYFNMKVVAEITRKHVQTALRRSNQSQRNRRLVPAISDGQEATNEYEFLKALKCYGANDDQSLLEDSRGLFRRFTVEKKHKLAVELGNFLEDAKKRIERKEMKHVTESRRFSGLYREFDDWLEYVALLNWHRAVLKQWDTWFHDRSYREDMVEGYKSMHLAFENLVKRGHEIILSGKKQEDPWLAGPDLRRIRGHAVVNVASLLLDVAIQCEMFEESEVHALINLIALPRYGICKDFRATGQQSSLIQKVRKLHLGMMDNQQQRQRRNGQS
mmetsp:Transcript_3446/g.8113  ORF Transcript_3446/g.8113 Transcript_3446/m.8113 type:complete len:927 (+) Transcript_3446:137-2917(+)